MGGGGGENPRAADWGGLGAGERKRARRGRGFGRIKKQVEAHGARFPEEDSFAYNPLDFVLFFKNLGVHFSRPCLAGIYRPL